MEFSADTRSLAEALDQVQKAVEKRSTISILPHVLVESLIDDTSSSHLFANVISRIGRTGRGTTDRS